MTESALVGYARVSANVQDLAGQQDARMLSLTAVSSSAVRELESCAAWPCPA
jgi:hypothetical protein